MQQLKLMTAILADGSQVTGTEVAQNIYGNEIILVSDDQEIPIDMSMCVAYFKTVEPIGPNGTMSSKSIESDNFKCSSHLLIREAY